MSLFGEKDTKIGAEFTFGVQSFKKIEGGYMLTMRQFLKMLKPYHQQLVEWEPLRLLSC